MRRSQIPSHAHRLAFCEARPLQGPSVGCRESCAHSPPGSFGRTSFLALFLALATWLSAFPAIAVEAVEEELPDAIATILRTSPIRGARAGVIVSDLETGEIVYGKNADELLNPASNVKILTTAAALARLGPDFRYPTEVLFGGPVDNGVLKGNLYLRGKGDPSLSTERLYGIVRQLRHLGLREVQGNLVADDTYFDAQYEGPGWDQDDSDRPYMAGAGALSLNLNAIEILVFPGQKVGEKARVVVEPASDYLVVDNQAVTTGPRSRSRIVASSDPQESRQRIAVRGRIALGRDRIVTYRRISHPPLFTGQTFRQILGEQGITVKGRVVKGETPSRLDPVLTDWSEPLPLLVHRLNKWSQNHMSEMLLKTLGAETFGAPGTWAKGVAAVETFLSEQVGIPRGSLVLRNGSGLNDTNRASARQILEVLTWAWKDARIGPELLASLPIAGVDGTTRNRLVGTLGEGRVRAKTGTLQNVTALSGYASAPNGRTYAFSIIVNDYPGRLSAVLPGVDAIGAAVASAGAIGGADAAVAMASLPTPDATTPIDQLRNRLATYQRLAASGREQAFLRTAWRTERDPALRPVIAELLYRQDPSDSTNVAAFLDSFSADHSIFGRLREAVGDGSLPVITTLVDLAASGNTLAISHLLHLVEATSAGDPLETELALGMAEVGKNAPDELLAALEEMRDDSQLKAVRLLAQGLSSSEEEEGALSEGTFANTLADEGADVRLTTFARTVETRLLGDEGTEAATH